VRITNYRKNGETFQNLLSMRPIHDSNGVYRFCIGVQFEVDGNTDLKKRLKKLGLLLQLLPSEIEVMHKSDKVGPKHMKKQTAADAGKNEDQLISQAMKQVADATEASDMQDEERYADHHQTMLDEIGGAATMSSAPTSYALPDKTVKILEALQKAGEGKGSLPAECGGSWLKALQMATEDLPIGVAITDMKVPGVVVQWCNIGFQIVTGYPKEETEGVNCRFLQGANTEPVVVTKMVRALRYGKDLTIDVTNYRKDANKFTNDLSLTPVHDSNGEYRYSLGVLSWKEKQTPEEVKALAKLRELLPRKMPADAQKQEFDQANVQVDNAQKQQQFRNSMVKFTKLLWTLDTESSLEKLMQVPDAYEAYHKFLEKTYEHTQLDFWAEARKLDYMDAGEQDTYAREICVKYLGMTSSDSASMNSASVAAKGAEFYKVLANDSFPRFVKSKACDPVVDTMLGENDRIDGSKELIWHKYKVPPDMEGFVYSFVAVAETFPACIVISDMSIPGNPMFFINQEFTKITGYSKKDAQGRNCRFLQGPKTEPASVAVIQDTLRRGVDCYVRITNYRKNGQTFQNLLSMRPIHDSNGVYRFCIGVQFEVDADTDLKKRLKKLGLLLQLLPTEIQVMHTSDKVGPKHLKKKTAADVGKTEDQLISQALEKTAAVADASDMQGGARFADHHQQMMEEIGGAGMDLAMEAADFKLPAATLKALTEMQKAGEGKGSIPKLGDGTWLGALKALVENLPIGVAITDMKVPGVNVLYCNKGFARVTGYQKEESEGRNCRFLQGANTEPVVVSKMVRALRYGKELSVEVTNYRKDDVAFINDLSLTPVHDSNGEYRYSLGILSWKEKQTPDEIKTLKAIRDALPRKMPADAQKADFDQASVAVDDGAKKKQFRASMIKFTKLLWTLDTESSVTKLMEVSSAKDAFHKFLKKSYEHTQLDFWLESKQVNGDDNAARGLCTKYLGMTEADAAAYSASKVEKKAKEFFKVLCNDSFPKFVKSKACDPVVDAMLGDTSKVDASKDLVWDKYKVPPDMEGFVYSFVAVAETFPACIVISDMSIPGNPMFFINQEFSKITGYSKKDAQGRNCRFLQGPKTEPASVAVIQDTLRRGVDCYVRITNYRKNGETFQNLLSMRPIHDSNGVYRFCIGVQFEVDGNTDLKKRLKKLGLLLQLLPSEIEVMHKSDKVGPKHMKKQTAADAGKNEDQLISQAMTQVAGVGDAGDMMGGARFADHHQQMLEDIGAVVQIEVKSVDAKSWKLPDKTVKILKELQKAGEKGGAIPKEGDGTWLAAFKAAIDEIPHAVAITDMKVPGVNVMWCNAGFERVSGYPKEETEGRNCRFLQGGGTESDVVSKMVRALRYAKELTIDVTNYRKEGPKFTNNLSLIPVHDSNGEYRYSMGILSDKERQTPDEVKALDMLRSLIPRKMPADAQPQTIDQSSVVVDDGAKKKQFRNSMIKFTKLLWTIDTESSLDKLMEVSAAKEAFHKFLEKTYEHTQLDFWLESRAIDGDEGAATKLCEKYLGMESGEAASMSPVAVEKKAAEFYKVLANDSFPKFVKSKACDPIVETMLGGADNIDANKKLVWDKYKVPPDMEGFIYSFVAVAETFPACIVISDMSIPGNPMFFINQEFTRITGYRKREAQGRNCRFLQGPKTEPASVAVIQDTLRRGVDCYVRITNYRKNGETFQNLLSMRPIHDSNGVYRFCIGVQFEVDGGTDLKKRLKKLGLLLQLLPSEIEVSHTDGAKAGKKHAKELKAAEQGKDEVEFIAQAMEKTADASDAADMQGSDRFADHHQQMLEEIGAMVEGDTVVDKKAWKLPDKTVKLLKALKDAGEGKGSIPKEGDGTWLAALKAAVEEIPHAVAITDMKVPGVNVMWCNGGFARVTGYPKDETEGRNCRFLQGKNTEPRVVTKMVRALRYAKELTIDVTNYRAEGLQFTNDLSLIPVHDSNGEYRYSLGLLSWKENQTPDEVKELEKLRDALPRKMPADAQPQEFIGDSVTVDDGAKAKQFRNSMIKFTKLLWTLDTEASLEKLMDTDEARKAFHKYLKKSYEHTQLDFWKESKSINADEAARELCVKYLGMTSADAASMDLKQVMNKAKEFYLVLANDSFPRFVKSKACDPVIETMLGDTNKMTDQSKDLIWKKYKVPADMEGFVYSFVAVAETFPACIVISDMSIPGNPMFFINQEFTNITGYSKSDAQGRNCRFLQGPLTEPASVAVIQDTLRRGVDCYVRITNYRKNGETFQNLLSMRPIHDTNGVYRFCIGVQFEVDAKTDLKKRLKKLGLLLQLLPSEIEVMHSNDKVGPKHKKELKAAEKNKTEDEMIVNAMEKVADASDANDMQGSDRYADHHQTMMEELGGGAVTAHDVKPDAADAGAKKKKGFFGR
jgi:PAS domain S-box-containing protein